VLKASDFRNLGAVRTEKGESQFCADVFYGRPLGAFKMVRTSFVDVLLIVIYLLNVDSRNFLLILTMFQYGYHLPQHVEDVVFCSIYFLQLSENLYTYPLICMRNRPVQYMPRCDGPKITKVWPHIFQISPTLGQCLLNCPLKFGFGRNRSRILLMQRRLTVTL